MHTCTCTIHLHNAKRRIGARGTAISRVLEDEEKEQKSSRTGSGSEDASSFFYRSGFRGIKTEASESHGAIETGEAEHAHTSVEMHRDDVRTYLNNVFRDKSARV